MISNIQQEHQLDKNISLFDQPTNSQEQQFECRQATEELLDEFKIIKAKLFDQVGEFVPGRRNGNVQRFAFRFVNVPDGCALGFLSNEYLRQHHTDLIKSLYFFRLHNQVSGGYSYGLYVCFTKFAPRRATQAFCGALVKFITGRKQYDIASAKPTRNKDSSMFDYIQTLFVTPKNLLVNFSCSIDAIPDNAPAINHEHLADFALSMKEEVSNIADNITLMPDKYEMSCLYRLLKYSQADYERHMKVTTLGDIVNQLCVNAYNIALQNPKFSQQQVQDLMNPSTRNGIVNRVITDRLVKSVQGILASTFGTKHIHPHPCSKLWLSDLQDLSPLDAMVFDYRFLFPVMMVARWFARACLTDPAVQTNCHIHLVLSGVTGAGKSLISSTLSAYIPTYRYLMNSQFQNPEMLSSSLVYIDECDTQQLASNRFKALLDIKTHITQDFKNLHPASVTKDVPFVISTNDQVFTALHSQQAKRFGATPQSVEAALRRLYIVPMWSGQYEKLHGHIDQKHPYFKQLGEYNNCLDSEENKLGRLFNLIVTLALYQQDTQGMTFNSKLHQYFNRLIDQFQQTIFGHFYMACKLSVDTIIKEVEDSMKQSDINDTEYQTQFAMSCTEFNILIQNFLKSQCKGLPDITNSIIECKTVPQPLKKYYLSARGFSMGFNTDFRRQLNQHVRHFIDSKCFAYFDIDQDIDNSENTSLGGNHYDYDEIDISGVMCGKRDRNIDTLFEELSEPFSKRFKTADHNDETFDFMQ